MEQTPKRFYLYLLIFLLILWFSGVKVYDVLFADSEIPQKQEESPKSNIVSKILKSEVIIDVPFILEAPDGIWKHPWSNACEEAVIMMVDKYYEGVKSVSVIEAKAYLQNLFDEEDRIFGSNRNTDSKQMITLIENYTNFKASVVTNPTLEDIKDELKAGRPVISLHFGFDLGNKNIGFAPNLSSYHTIVLVGFDDNKKEFITHDPGDDIEGENHIYTYDTVMNSLHDYNYARNKADGVPTVLFTDKKEI